jgi:hypothetical protein
MMCARPWPVAGSTTGSAAALSTSYLYYANTFGRPRPNEHHTAGHISSLNDK